MVQALTQSTYGFKGDKVILEPKDLIKVKIGFSPDEMDAAMLTFAAPVIRGASVNMASSMPSRHTFEYNPLAPAYIHGQSPAPSTDPTRFYNPTQHRT